MQARAVFEAAAIVQKEGIKVEPEIMIPLVGFKKELDLQVEVVHQVAARGAGREEGQGQVPGRHDDRDPARRADRRRDRADGRVLQLRHQRPDADRPRHVARRLGLVPAALSASSRSSRRTRSRRSTQTGVGQLVRDRASSKGRADAARHQARHLRRARRRPGVDPVLREGRARLRQLLAVPRAGRAAGGGAGGACRRKVGPSLHDHRLRPARTASTEQVATASTAAWLQPGSRRRWCGSTSPRRRFRKALHPHRRRSTSTSWRSRTRCRARQYPEGRSLRRLPLPHPARHRLPGGRARASRTHDVDFFVGPNYLVTVHDGDSRVDRRAARSRARATRRSSARARWRCCTASSTRWSTHYRPEVDKLEERLDELEKRIFDQPEPTAGRGRSSTSSATSPSLRRVVMPQRDVVARLARREFVDHQHRDVVTASATSTITSSGSPTMR